MLDTSTTTDINPGTQLWEKLKISRYRGDPELVQIIDAVSFPKKRLKGATRFFRHDLDYSRYVGLAEKIRARTRQDSMRILCCAGSVGAEAYSIAHAIHERGHDGWLNVATTDLSPLFTAVAASGVYPAFMARVNRASKQTLFSAEAGGYITINEKFRKTVSVLPSAPIDKSDAEGDILILSNVLGHMGVRMQRKSLQIAASRARYAVAVMSGDFNDMAEHMKAAGLFTDSQRHYTREELCINQKFGFATIGYKSSFFQ